METLRSIVANLCRRTAATFLAGVAVFAAPAAFAAERLFDFSVSDCGWKSNSKIYVLKRSGEYPVAGTRGLFFSGPKWEKGEASIWPSFETRTLPTKDWSRYDRLVFTVYNDSAVVMHFRIFISDSKISVTQGANFSYPLCPFSSKQFVLPLKQFLAAWKVDPTDISVVHCNTRNPERAVRFFVDDFTLLEPGEAVPELPKSYLKKIRRRQNTILASRLKQLEAETTTFDIRTLSPENASYVQERINVQLARLRSGEVNDLLLASKNGTLPEWDSLRSLVSAISGFAALRQTVAAAPGFEDVLLGYATPMEKVLPRAPVFRPLPETIVIEAARNEKEAAQLIVMPLEKERKKVGVRLTSFTGPAGALPGSALSAAPVGFVETTFVPYSGSEYIGFWPDPLLSFLDAVDVKAGEAQMFWIRAEIPAGQPAGVYTGKADVTIDGQPAFSIPVSVRVRDFALPNRSMLPLAVTFWPQDAQMPRCNPNFDPEARNSPDAPVHAWEKHKKEWCDLLAGYYLMIDSLYEYGGWKPEFEFFAELDKEGKLGLFNLGNFHPASKNPAYNYGMSSTINRIRPRYEKAKQLGLLNHAYIYGCDENTAEAFPDVERAAAILKKEFPGVPIFTTAYDESYGTDGRLKSIDWFCPLTDKFNERQAIAARKAGKQVWWYICNGPWRPYANNFIESSGIETRLLLGAMGAKYRPDGFLYYQTGKWNSTAPVTSGPYTSWCAQSSPESNGDGSWTYPGPDSTPLGSIRLENFRDGLEDYAYARILEQRLSAAKQAGKNPQWQQEAEAALAVPATLVKSLTEYTRDPQKVYAWRSRLAELIERAPIK